MFTPSPTPETIAAETTEQRSTSTLHRAAGLLTAGLLAFSLTACDMLGGSDDDSDDREQISQNEDDGEGDGAEDEQDDKADSDASEEPTDEAEDDSTDGSTDESTDEATDEATDGETSDASGSDTFQGSSDSEEDSFGGSDEGSESGSDATEFSTDDPDPLSGSTGTSSTEFTESVQEAYDQRQWAEGEVTGVSVYDEEMGNGVEVTKVIRDFPSPSNSFYLQNGGEVILLYVEPDAGQEQYSKVNKLFFLGPQGQEQRNTLLMDDELEGAGLTPYDNYGDDSQPGWVAFVIQEPTEDHNLAVVRPETEILSSDEVLPQQVWEFDLQSQ